MNPHTAKLCSVFKVPTVACLSAVYFFGCDSNRFGFSFKTVFVAAFRLLNSSLTNLSRLFHCSVIKVLLSFCFERQLLYIIIVICSCQQLFSIFLIFFSRKSYVNYVFLCRTLKTPPFIRRWSFIISSLFFHVNTFGQDFFLFFGLIFSRSTSCICSNF